MDEYFAEFDNGSSYRYGAPKILVGIDIEKRNQLEGEVRPIFQDLGDKKARNLGFDSYIEVSDDAEDALNEILFEVLQKIVEAKKPKPVPKK